MFLLNVSHPPAGGFVETNAEGIHDPQAIKIQKRSPALCSRVVGNLQIWMQSHAGPLDRFLQLHGPGHCRTDNEFRLGLLPFRVLTGRNTSTSQAIVHH
jgi:hypothetical protein